MLFVHRICICHRVLSMLSLRRRKKKHNRLEMKVTVKFVAVEVNLLDVCGFRSSSPLELQFHL